MHPDNIWVNGIFSSCTISPGCILHVSKKYFYAWAMNMGFKKNSCLKYFSFILFFFTYTVLQIGKGFWNIFCLYSCKILKGWVFFKYPKISLNIIQKDFHLFFFFWKIQKTGGGIRFFFMNTEHKRGIQFFCAKKLTSLQVIQLVCQF